MKFLLDIFKKSSKGNGLRSPEATDNYNDGIAKLNSLGANQYQQLTTQNINKISKNNTTLSQNSTGNSTIPGSR
jgi:hypothetical protein